MFINDVDFFYSGGLGVEVGMVGVRQIREEMYLYHHSLKTSKIVKMLPLVFQQDLSVKTLNPCTKEDTENDDYCNRDGPLDDEEDLQTDEMQVDSTKECDDDMEEPCSVSDKEILMNLFNLFFCWIYSEKWNEDIINVVYKLDEIYLIF